MPKIKGRGNTGRKIFVMIIVVALAIGLFQLGKMSVKDNKEIVVDTNKNSDTKTDAKNDDKVTATTGKIAESSKKFNIDVKYPVLAGIANKTIQDKINASIKDSVNSTINTFKDDVNSAGEVTIELGGKNEVNGDYQFFGNYKGIVSVEERMSEYSIGSAHPNNYSNTYSFNISDGSLVNDITDLCIDKSNCLPSIAKLTQKYLKTVLAKMQVGSQDWTTEGSSAKLDNYQDFMIVETGLKIVFDPYQVAPYSAGTIYVTVPWSDLSGIIKTELIK